MEDTSGSISPMAKEESTGDSMPSKDEYGQLKPQGSDADAMPTLVEVALTAHKGLGLFATQYIKRGTRILAEVSLVALPPTEKHSHNLHKEFEKLSPAQMKEFTELHHEINKFDFLQRAIVHQRLSTTRQYYGLELELAVDDEMKLRAIFETNVVQMGSQRQFGSGVFPLYSRINHSCIPNVHNSYNATIGKEIVYAIRDIAQGEEILTSYINLLRTREQRSEPLARYGFECDCEACIGSKAAEHEERRKRVFEIDQSFAVMQNENAFLALMSPASLPKGDAQALELARELVSLLKEEGLTGTDLSNAFRECSRCNLALGEIEQAKMYAVQEQEVERYCIGEETAHLEPGMEAAEFWIKHIDSVAEKDRVKINDNRKRALKEVKKAAKKAVKGKH